MEIDFRRYLQAKRTVDDRALNRGVWEVMKNRVKGGVRVVEVGCGIGTMLNRMQGWGLLDTNAGYTGIDVDPANIAAAQAVSPGPGVHFERADLFDWAPKTPCDLLVASAFLDLVGLDQALPRLHGFLQPGGLGYFPLNFDGVTIFEPAHAADERILAAYHASMDNRPTGGHSRTGRLLFNALPAAGFEILAAGSSDWVVHATPGGAYAADEAYFLHHLLHFFETSCAGVDGLSDWLEVRRSQIERGELVYIAHQLDFLVQSP